jgi:TPR repeat protein
MLLQTDFVHSLLFCTVVNGVWRVFRGPNGFQGRREHNRGCKRDECRRGMGAHGESIASTDVPRSALGSRDRVSYFPRAISIGRRHYHVHVSIDTERVGRICETAGNWTDAFGFYQCMQPPTPWTDYKLGYCYAVGMNVVHIDIAQAFTLLQRAESGGSAEASSLLDELHLELHDRYPPMRLQRSLQELAARRPHRPHSDLNVDPIHWVLTARYNNFETELGHPVFFMSPNVAGDPRYLEVRRRATIGCIRSQRALGMLLRLYRPNESRRWMGRAATAGHAWARLDIYGNEGDHSAWYNHLLCSAHQGWLCAMKRLSDWHSNKHYSQHEVGRQSHDLVESHKWLRLVSMAGSEDARQHYEALIMGGKYADLPDKPNDN